MGRRSSPRIRAAAAAASQNQSNHSNQTSQSNHSNHSPRRRSDIDLMMECNDDDLSPYQINALKRAQEEHEKANALIKEARSKAVLAQQQPTMVMTHTAPQMHVTGVQQLRQMPNLQQQKNVVSPTKASQSDDVIVIGETRPAIKTLPSKVTNPLSGPQGTPTMPTLTRPSMSQQVPKGSPIPQQVYKFINIQNTSTNIAPGQWVIRPLVPVVPQQQQQKQQAPAHPPTLQRAPAPLQQLAAKSPALDNKSDANIISGTHGFGIKRPPGYTGSDEIAKKKPRQETDEKVDNWVPLEDYYYGKKEGDASYTEEKGEYRFKCWYCSKMLYNNVRTMQHLQGHIDSSKQQNLDLSDLTQCKHCYKQFDTPFEMQTHMEKVHLSTKVLMCRICEKDQDTYGALGNHMKQCHMACEMPYVCQLCNFRSSMYSDVVDHFKKKHDSSQHLLCLYCLRIFRVKFVSQGWGQTQTYYGHLLKHQSKSSTKKCATCRLTFFNSQDVKSHRKKDHIENQKETGVAGEQSTSNEMMIKVPESGLHRSKVKSLNAPSISKVMDIGVVHLPASADDYLCFECKTSMGSAEHYKKHVNCSMCRFATSCSVAYANHMMGFHSRQMWSLNLNIPWERPRTEKMHCLCGYTSKYGNKIANHLVFCSKQTCYTKKPDVLWKDSADESSGGDPDSPEKPGTSLLDILGLVKKKNLMTPEGVSPSQEVKVAENVQRTKLPAPVPKSFARSSKQNMNISSEVAGGETMVTENKNESNSVKSGDLVADHDFSLQIPSNVISDANVKSSQKDVSVKSKDSLQLDLKTENSNLVSTVTEDSNLVSAETENSNLVNAETENSNLVNAETENSNLVSNETENSNVMSAETENGNLVDAETEDSNLVSAETENSNLVSTETENSNLVHTETKNSNLVSTETENSNIVSTETKNSNLVSTETENSNLLNAETQDSKRDSSDISTSEKLIKSNDMATAEESQIVEKDVVESVEGKTEKIKTKSMKKDISHDLVASRKEISDFDAEKSGKNAKDETEKMAAVSDSTIKLEVDMETKQDHSATVTVKEDESKMPIKTDESISPIETADSDVDQQDSSDVNTNPSVINRSDPVSIDAKDNEGKDINSTAVQPRLDVCSETPDSLPILSSENLHQTLDSGDQGEGSKELAAIKNICKEGDSHINESISEQSVEPDLVRSEIDNIEEDVIKIEKDASTGQCDAEMAGESASNTQANPEESKEIQSGDDRSSDKNAKDDEQLRDEHQPKDRDESPDSCQSKVKDKDVHSTRSYRHQRESDKRHHDDRSFVSSRSGESYHGNKSHDRSRDRERYERDRYRDDFHHRQYSGSWDHQHQSSRYQGQDNRNQGQGHRGRGGYDRSRDGYDRERNYDRNYQNYNRRGGGGGYRGGYY